MKSNKASKENDENIIYKCSLPRKGLFCCNTLNNGIIIVDSLGSRKIIYIDDYKGNSNYPPIIIDKNTILIQSEIGEDKYLIKYNFKQEKELWRAKVNEKLISHVYINDSNILLGFDSSVYKNLNCKTNSMEEIFDFSKSSDVYNSNGLLKNKGNDIYILSPVLGKRSLIKINIQLKKIIWESPINFNFINFSLTEKGIFYLGTNDFDTGEIGFIDLKDGKIIHNQKAYPNVLVAPLVVDNENIFYGDTRGKIMNFSMSNFAQKTVYSSLNKNAFLGVGSALLYSLDHDIYFIDNFKIFRIMNKSKNVEFVKDHKTLGFNFIVKDSLKELKIY